MKKGFFAAFLCALIMVLLPAAVYAMDGTGTEGNPYQISSAADLEEFRDIVNGENGRTQNSSACAILKDDIVLDCDKDNQWTPIGYYKSSSDYILYTGTFDGTGHKISGIYINSASNNQGLFGYIGENGEVKNLGLVDSSIHGNSYVGSIAGISKGSIKDCYNEGEVKGNNTVGGIAGKSEGSASIKDCHNTGSVSGEYEIGGIAGESVGTIEDCYNTGDVSSTSSFVGGIVGSGWKDITNCYNTGDVSSETGEYVGGIVGIMESGNASITNCYNEGSVSGNNDYVGGIAGASSRSNIEKCHNTGSVSGSDRRTGGIAGHSSGRIEGCYNEGKVSGNDSVGGIAGRSEGSITDCYNEGDVSSETGELVGGIAGKSEGSITDCYNEGGVSNENGMFVGGITGYIEGDTEKSHITECYNKGDVRGYGYVGGIAGESDGSITDCYNEGGVSSASGGSFLGGIVGSSAGRSITDCYNTGSISGMYDVGGIMGFSENSSVNITNCYNTGSVSGSDYVGGIVGGGISCSVTNSYYLEGSGKDNGNGTMLTETEFADIKKFTDWDFVGEDAVWKMDVGLARPVLKSNPEESNFGDGTEDDPYLIYNASQLTAFRGAVNSGNRNIWAELKSDIVLNCDENNQWTPIGTEEVPYNGTFDGNGHTVSGIYINTYEDNQGLFGYIGSNGTVKDLGIEKSRIKGGNNVGGIAGYSSGSIEDCYNTGSVSGGNNVGGIAGTADSAKDCHNEGTVSGSDCVGGILGSGAGLNGVVNRCYNTGDISGEGGVGGIAGRNILGVTNSYNTGTISGEYASGIAGGSRMGVINCYNIGKVGYNAISGAHDMGGSANNYYLKGCTSEENDEEEQTAEEKTFDEFASGEVAYLLMEKGNSEAIKAEWGQRIGDDFPIITDDEDLRVYKVTFMVNGKEYAVAYGNSYGVLVMPDAPLLSGGGFKYWVDEDGEKFTKDSSVKKNMTVTADKNPRYELTEGSALRFETNGGTEIKTVYAEKGDVIDLSGYVTERSGYIFDGWYTGNDFEEKADEIEIDGGMTVYAKWIKDERGESGESVTSAQTFTDVSIFDWYNEGVMYVSENGIMNGVGGNKFEPDTKLKREMLATILWNMEGKPEPKDIAPFLDVMSGEYYSKAIAWAGENGIISGYGSEYGVGEAVTREDFAAILYRYAVYKGYDTTQGGMAVREFADYEEISEYAKAPVGWAVNTGIISGMGNGSISPKTTTSRGQAAVMLMNFCKNVK